jgi:hypothetical protein
MPIIDAITTVTKTAGAGIVLKVSYVAASGANDAGVSATVIKATRIDLQLATRTIDNKGFYQKDVVVIPDPDTVNKPDDGYAIFDLTYSELVFLFGQSVVDGDVAYPTVAEMSYRHRAYGTVGENENFLITTATTGDVIAYNASPERPHGTSTDTNTVSDEDTVIRITGHDQKITFDFTVTSAFGLTNMDGDELTASTTENPATQVEIMFNRAEDFPGLGIQSVIVNVQDVTPTELSGSFNVIGHTTKGTLAENGQFVDGPGQITLINDVKYEIAMRCCNVHGKSPYSKSQTVKCSNKMSTVTVARETGNPIKYLDDVYTSFQPEVYFPTNSLGETNVKFNQYHIENRNEIYAAQILAKLLDNDAHKPNVLQVEFGVLSADTAVKEADDTTDIYYPDTNPYNNVPDDPTDPRKVLAFVPGKYDTYTINTNNGTRYTNTSDVILATSVISKNINGDPNSGDGESYAGYNGLVINAGAQAHKGLFVRNNWYDGVETDILISVRVIQTTMVPGPVDPATGLNTADVPNVVYGEVEELGKIFKATAPQLFDVRLSATVSEGDGTQFMTCNKADTGEAGVVLNEDTPTVKLVVTDGDGLNLTFSGGYGYDGFGGGSGYEGIVGTPDPNQPILSIDGTTVKFGSLDATPPTPNYSIDYAALLAIPPETGLVFTDDAINSAPSRKVTFSLYQGDANKTNHPSGHDADGSIIQYADNKHILLHPFKRAADPDVTWTGQGVNEIPRISASQHTPAVVTDPTADPPTVAATTNTGVSDNNGFIFQTTSATDPSQPAASNKYRAVVKKTKSGPTGVTGALAADQTIADFYFNGEERNATAGPAGTSYSLPKDNTDAALKIPGNIGNYEVTVQKLLKLSPANHTLYADWYTTATHAAETLYPDASNLNADTNGTDGLSPMTMGGYPTSQFGPQTIKGQALYYESPTITGVVIESTGTQYPNNTMTIIGNTGGASYLLSNKPVTSIGFIADPVTTGAAADNVGYSMSNISQNMNTEPGTAIAGSIGQPGTANTGGAGYNADKVGHYDYTVSIEHPGTLLADLSGGATFDGIAFVNSTNADSAITIVDNYPYPVPE